MASAAPVAVPQLALLYQRPVKTPLEVQAFFVGGKESKIELDPNGYLDALKVRIRGTMDVATTPLVLSRLPYAIVRKFLVEAAGRVTPIDIDGASMHVWNLRSNDFGTFPLPSRPANRDGLDTNAVYSRDDFPVAASTNAFELSWIIPFHMSVIDHRGSLPLGAMRSKTYLRVTPVASFLEFVTDDSDISNFAATIEVEQIAYSAPPADAFVIPGSTGDGWAVVYESTSDPIVTAGKPTKIDVTPEDIILGILHEVVVDLLADSADVESLYFRVAETWFNGVEGQPGDVKTIDDADEHGGPLPTGWFIWDQDLPATGMAGWIHPEGINKIEVGIQIASGTSLGSPGRSYVTTSTRKLVNVNAAGSAVGAAG